MGTRQSYIKYRTPDDVAPAEMINTKPTEKKKTRGGGAQVDLRDQTVKGVNVASNPLGINVGIKVRPPQPNISLGPRNIPVQQPRQVISRVGPTRVTVTETPTLHRPTEQPRRVTVPPKVLVPTGTIPELSKLPVPKLPVLPTSIGEEPVALDLGSLITQLGTAYIGAKYAPTQPMYTMPTVYESTPADFGLPFVDVIPEATSGPSGGTGNQVWNPRANCGAGKWQRRSRRRRKRLATSSDLKDLAALKGVLGGGKAFEVWIATHS